MTDVAAYDKQKAQMLQVSVKYKIYDPKKELSDRGLDCTLVPTSSGVVGVVRPVRLPVPEVVQLAILSSRIFFLYESRLVSVAQMVVEYQWKWLHVSNVGIFRMFYPHVVSIIGSDLPVPSPPVTRRKFFWIYSLDGPRPEDVNMQRVEEFDDRTVCVDYYSEDHFFRRGEVSEPANVPYLQARLSQYHWEKNWTTEKYHQSEYYQRSLYSYSTWSYSLHQQQLSGLLQCIPEGSIVAAPGDGMGVVHRMFAGRSVFSGDINSICSHVKKEEFWQTLSRAESYSSQFPKRSMYVVLSYVTAFFCQKDWDTLKRFKCPIFILDSHFVVRPELGFCQVLGDGLIAYSYDASGWFQMKKESVRFEKRVRYSENLLALKDFYVETITEALLYRVQMSCVETVRCANSVVAGALTSLGVSTTFEISGPLLLDNIRDYVLNPRDNVYVASIGKEVSEICDCPDRGPLSSRVIYVVDDSPLWRARTGLIDRTLVNGRLYFCWALDSDISLPYSYVSRDCVDKGCLVFKKMVVRDRDVTHLVLSGSQILLSFRGDTLLLPLRLLSALVLTYFYFDWRPTASQLILRILKKISVDYPDFEASRWVSEPWAVFDSYFVKQRVNRSDLQIGPYFIPLALLEGYGSVSLSGSFEWSCFIRREMSVSRCIGSS